MVAIARGVAVGLILAGLPACTKTHVKTPAAPVGLNLPQPPERVIVPPPMPETVETAPLPVPPSIPPARPRETPVVRPSPPPAAPPAPAVAEPAAATPPPVLQLTSNPAQIEQRAVALIAAARHDLDQINPAQLNRNARAQYDLSKSFITQAEDQLKARNVVLARDLAEKAASLASQLRR